jgi:hypothetical protein
MTDMTDIPQPALRDSVLAKADDLVSTVIFLQFASEVTWDLTVLIDDFVAWLYDPIVQQSKTAKGQIFNA